MLLQLGDQFLIADDRNFILYLFNNPVHSSDYKLSNNKFHEGTLKDMEESKPWSDLKCYPGICLEGLRKLNGLKHTYVTHKNIIPLPEQSSEHSNLATIWTKGDRFPAGQGSSLLYDVY
jgi:hypothetical protein